MIPETVDEPCLILKTVLDMEKLVASRISEVFPYLKAVPSPEGYKGVVLVYGCRNPRMELDKLGEEVIEIERGYIIRAIAEATIPSIVDALRSIAKELVSEKQCFAVRTVRRGSHEYTSIDVNIAAGAVVKEETGACVDLSNPDIVIGIEIIKNKAYITSFLGTMLWKKFGKGKKMLYNLFRNISVIQMPYIAEPEVSYKMGVRIGRAVQNFEIKEIVVAPIGIVDAHPVSKFIEGLIEGIRSRYLIQKKSYSRKPRQVKVKLQDLYQLVRARRNEPLIVLEPEGEYIGDIGENLYNIITNYKRVNVLVGAREGIPLGVYRIANKVIDIAPGITLSTDFAAITGLIAIATTIYDWVEQYEENSNSFSSR